MCLVDLIRFLLSVCLIVWNRFVIKLLVILSVFIVISVLRCLLWNLIIHNWITLPILLIRILILINIRLYLLVLVLELLPHKNMLNQLGVQFLPLFKIVCLRSILDIHLVIFRHVLRRIPPIVLGVVGCTLFVGEVGKELLQSSLSDVHGEMGH